MKFDMALLRKFLSVWHVGFHTIIFVFASGAFPTRAVLSGRRQRPRGQERGAARTSCCCGRWGTSATWRAASSSRGPPPSGSSPCTSSSATSSSSPSGGLPAPLSTSMEPDRSIFFGICPEYFTWASLKLKSFKNWSKIAQNHTKCTTRPPRLSKMADTIPKWETVL